MLEAPHRERTVVRWLTAGLGGLALVVSTPVAHAFSIQNAIRPGCHEDITTDALRAVRRDLPTAGPIGASGDDRAMIDDAAFDIPDDMKDLSGGALLFGLREPDLHGQSNHSVDALALAHGTDEDQPWHCLRRSHDNEPSGTAEALEACRTRILTEFEKSLDGLDAGSAPDVSIREDFDVALGLRGKLEVHLPVFHVHMGAALHATQDSFAHMLRTTEGMQVTTVLNWIDWVNDEFKEDRDGPQHLSALDQCDPGVHPIVAQRRQLATAASEALLRAALDPALTRDQKLAQASTTVEGFLAYQDGCNASNHWCDAPEFDVPEPGCLCQTTGRGASGAWPAVGAVAAMAAWLGRRRRGAARVASALAVGLLLLAGGGEARADEQAAAPVAKLPEPKPDSGFAGYVALGGSVDRVGAAGILGGRYRFSTRWIVGVDAEWNPWFNSGRLEFRKGAINAYGTIIRQYPMFYESLNLRTTLNLGTSFLLQDLVGAPAGRPGLFFGISPLGVEWRMRRDLYLVFDPVHIIVPVPQLTGIPFAYPQYRMAVGLEFG